MGQADPVGGQNPQAPPRAIPFGKYLLLDRIAVGGMAEVYTAKSFGIEGFEKIIACKRILPTMAEDRDFISMFIDEAKIAGHLTHANIVPIYELGKIGESHYIAMEYVWGKDLLQIMNRFRRMRRHMPPVMAAWIASKMLEGLDYAHRKRDRHGRPMGIIHRDVSPQNCLVSYEGQVKLIDFGIAKAASRNTKTQAGVLKGKFGYMSPEQVRGNTVDHRSDIFAASTCLHEMLTGERLFVGESDFSTLEKVRNADVIPPSTSVPEMSPELEEILMKGLAREPDDRWSTAGEMQEALQRYIALQRPPFGTSKLNTWMRTAFAPEIAKEKGRLDSFSKIGHPGTGAPPSPQPRVPGLSATSPQNPAARTPPQPQKQVASLDDFAHMGSIGDDDGEEMGGEATMITSSPFDAMEAAKAAGGGFEEIAEQATQIFFNAEEMEVIDDDSPTLSPAGSLSSTPAVQAARMPAPRPVGVPGPVSGPGSMNTGPMNTGPMPMSAGPMSAGPMSAGQPMSAPNAKATMRLDSPIVQPPQQQQQHHQAGGPDMFAPPPPAYPSQRNMQTMEVERPGQMPARPAKKKEGGLGKLIAIVAVAAILVLAFTVGGAFLLFSGGDTGTVRVLVLGVPDNVNARVFVDGVQRGDAPLMLEHVPEGEHVIEVRAAGYQNAARSVPVTADGTVMLEIQLEADNTVAGGPPPGGGGAPRPPPTPPPPPPRGGVAQLSATWIRRTRLSPGPRRRSRR
jgi:serine/threonine protein kinase